LVSLGVQAVVETDAALADRLVVRVALYDLGMAKAKDKTDETQTDASGTSEVSNEGSVPVVAVEHPGEENTNDEFLKEQDEAYLEYRATGRQGKYIDALRDQEPDIAPEFGVAPHPELANAAPPEGFYTGEALNPDANPVVRPFEEKVADADVNLVEASQEAAEDQKAQAEEEQAAVDAGESIQQTALEEGQFAGRVADESPKAAAGNARAKA
jgi:hypothetical protein